MPALLRESFYTPARGGHAPGDLREAFGEAIDAFVAWEDGEPEPAVELRDQHVAISQVCGLLWNCSDILPHLLIQALGDEGAGFSAHTYGAASRWLKSQVEATLAG